MTPKAVAQVLSKESPDKAAPLAKAQTRFGHIVSVSGSQAVAALEVFHQFPGTAGLKRIEIGALVKIPTPASSVVGIVSALSSPMPVGPSDDKEIRLVELSLAGEILTDERSGALTFRRGVSNSPALGDAVAYASREELACVYIQTS